MSLDIITKNFQKGLSDLLKIDTEGEDLNILKGSEKL